MPQDEAPDTDRKGRPSRPQGNRASWGHRVLRVAGSLAGLAVAGAVAVVVLVGVALAMAYPNLPDVAELADYRPKLPLRVYTAEGQLMGEFGEERRNLTPIGDIPDIMKQAVLAIEDARFFEHHG
ncbi:MAG: transglycosylase domain-containing protein, partial [Gammaproteobacteria bacterium]